MSDSIADALNVSVSTPESNNTGTEIVPVAKESSPHADFDVATNNLKGLITEGDKALKEIMEVAQLSQHPRAYEVVGGILKTMADINRQIAEIAKDRIKHASVNASNENKKATNVFIGSTADLAEFMKKQKNNDR